MLLLTFPLLVVSAPVLLLARGRYGARLFVGLVIAMLTPVALFFVEGMLMAALRRPDVLPTSLKAFATTLLLINMHVAFVLPVHLLDLLQRFLRRSALPVAPGAILTIHQFCQTDQRSGSPQSACRHV